MTTEVSNQSRRHWRLVHKSQGAPVRATDLAFPISAAREWAIGDSDGSGVSICLIDSGVDPNHRDSEPLDATLTLVSDSWGTHIELDDAGDVAGHGTACASIIHRTAPAARITSLRILGSGLAASGDSLISALGWALDQRFDLVNLSLSSRKPQFKEQLHDLADLAYYRRVAIVASAHNSPVTSYPWTFPSVISVGSHGHPDSAWLECNPDPPVDFFAMGVSVPIVRSDGSHGFVTGNSFATPHVTALCARILSKHPGCSVSRLRAILALASDNVV